MPEDRTNSEPADKTAAAPAPAAGGFKSWLPLIVSILLLPALAFGMAQYVLLPQLQKGLGMKAASGDAAVDSKSKKMARTPSSNRCR